MVKGRKGNTMCLIKFDMLEFAILDLLKVSRADCIFNVLGVRQYHVQIQAFCRLNIAVRNSIVP